MILASAELRWFSPGGLPAEMVAWFDREKASHESRTDTYVALSGTNVVGVKVRSGKLEVKAITKGPHEVRLPDNVIGRSEHWIKWSFDLDGESDFAVAVRDSDPVIDVMKERRLVKYASSRDGLERVPVDRRIEAGCNVELTALQVSTRHWWTFGFEAYGEGGLDEALLSTARMVIVQPGLGAILGSSICQSYPSWLSDLGRS